jgi:Mg2+ and Co2+ transporter CorA
MNRHEQDLFENMLDVLRKIEERLKVIEESVKKEKPKKQLLND